MNALLQFHRIAAQRGDGLLPEFIGIFERQPVKAPEADFYLRTELDEAPTEQSEQISGLPSVREY